MDRLRGRGRARGGACQDDRELSRRAVVRGPGVLRAALRHPLAPLAALLALALGLRVFLSFALQPAALNQYDANSYVWQAEGELFESVYQAPGYSLFLRAAHLVSDNVAFTVSVQHLLALATATVLWWTARRLTGSRWLGLIPAGVVLFNFDSLLLEHSLMSETVFTLLVAGAVACAVGAIESPRKPAWLVGAGFLVGAAIWVRYAGIALVPVFALWTLVALWPGRRRAPLLAAATLAPIAIMLAGAVVGEGRQTGAYGLGQNGGWALFSRVGQFASCQEFTPAPEARVLCDETSIEDRKWPDWYGYNALSPSVKVFGGPPNGNEVLGRFARQAIIAQPRAYAEAVLSDLWLYVADASWTNRNRSLIGPRALSFRLRTPDEHCGPDRCRPPTQSLETATIAGWTHPSYDSYYEEFTPTTTAGIRFFEEAQRVLRMHGPLFGILIALSLAGLLAIRGPLAKAQWLLVGTAGALLVFPVAGATYNVRYGIPATGLIALSATLAPLALREGAGWTGRVLAAARGGRRRRE